MPEEAVEVPEKRSTALGLCRTPYALGTHGGTDGGPRVSVFERALETAVDRGGDA
ncbi:hypothetical protein [Streptomyces clavifer]|uniref:hypothetical protein n=1 Tax=Streptomyces clavifer TaxID=68188 RepID=UPI0033AF1EEB